MKGIVITSEGTTTIQGFSNPLHESLRSVLGGYFEIVNIQITNKYFLLIIDEDGLIKKLTPNYIASQLYHHLIVGTAIIMKQSEEDIVGLDNNDIDLIMNHLKSIKVTLF